MVKHPFSEEHASISDRLTFGKLLRAARKKQGWTLENLSEKSGVSMTTISRAERGLLALGYDNLVSLGRALDMELGTMFLPPSKVCHTVDTPVLTRSGEGVRYKGLFIEYAFLGANVDSKKMTPVLGTVHARTFNGPEDYSRHDGEEFVYVLSGIIDVYFENQDPIRLNKGDSLYYNSQVGHAYVSVSKSLAQVISVMTVASDFYKEADEIKQHKLCCPN